MFERLTRAIRQNPAASALFATLVTYAAYAWAADTQIDALTDGDPAQAADQIPINRPADTDRRITAGTIRYLQDTMINGSIVTDSPGTDQNDYSPTGWDGTEPSKATMIRITPTQSIRITGLAGGDANGARYALLCNALDSTGANGEIIILEHENASSTAANRFRFADRFAKLLIPDTCLELIYDDTTDRWREVKPEPWTSVFHVYSDMTAVSGTSITANNLDLFSVNGAGTAFGCQGINFQAGATEDPIGTVECDTGTGAGTGRIMFGETNGTTNGTRESIALTQGQTLFVARVAVGGLSDATDEYDFMVGWEDSDPADTGSTDGVYWYYDRNTSTAWQYVCEGAGTQSATPSGLTVAANTLVYLLIYSTGDGTEADFYYTDGGSSWTRGGEQSGANCPTSTELVSVGISAIDSAGSATDNFYIDLMGWRYDMQRGN